MVSAGLKQFVLGSPLLLSAGAFLVVLSFIRFLMNRPKRLDLPIVGEPDDADHLKAMIEGTAKYPDSPYILPSSPPLVILPISVINEVRNLPEDKASFIKDVQRMFATKHTGVESGGYALVQSVKISLTRHIASTLDDLQDEVRYSFDKEFGTCEDWTPITVYSKMARIIALLSGRVFVGRPLSREEEWIQATIMFTFYCHQAKDAINAYPEWARGIAAYFSPEVKRVWEFKNRGAKLLQPILDAQMAKTGKEKIHRDDSEDEQGTFISWMLNFTNEDQRRDPLILANNQMGLSMAAIHSTTTTVTAIIYDLAAHPEYIQPLQDEIQQIINEDGQDVNGNGFMHLKKESMSKLWKLDSFMKESQRLTPTHLPTNVRITTAPLTLSTGHTLPTGTRFGFAAYAIHHSPIFSSSAASRPVTEFDGFRFYKLRKIPGNENKHQFVVTSSDSLNFGHGNHACPGRFFASNEIKIVLIELLRNWDFRFLEGNGRPENVLRGLVCGPDTKGMMELRRRKG